MLKIMPLKVTSKARAVANTAKAGKGVKVNSAANNQAVTNTRNKPTAMPTTGNFRSRTQPRRAAKRSELQRLM